MHTLKFLQELFNRQLEELSYIKEPKELYTPIEYTLALGGKRLRPCLCLSTCEMFGNDINNAMDVAIGIEMFHNFTLLHDDLMDNSPIRRGKETVYKKWNNNVAILSGDTMFALAYGYVIKNEHNLKDVLAVFNQTAIEVCEGQQYDMEFEDRDDVTEAEYMQMIYLKTAVLLAASLKIGAILSDASKEDTDLLYDFGINIGLAFQLKDDLLDVYSDQAVFGKKTGNDIITNKKTFLLINAFEKANATQKEALHRLFYTDIEISNEEKIRQVMKIYDEVGIKKITEDAITAYQEKALEILEKVSVEADKKKILHEIVDYLYKREK